MRLFLSVLAAAAVVHGRVIPHDARSQANHHQVVILGGGVAGIIAARTLHDKKIDNFLIIEARDELGGRMHSFKFGNTTVELGANWVQGTQRGTAPANPIWDLAKRHGVLTVESHFEDSMTTYDETGLVNYIDKVHAAGDIYDNLTVAGGARVPRQLVDLTARTGYSMIGSQPKDPHTQVSECTYHFDWEYAQTPEQTSWIASSWANNYTFEGFSDENRLCIDQRGFKTLIQQEASHFLTKGQARLSSTVKTISYTSSGVSIELATGETITADYAICTFSLGVLQNNDVQFSPELPAWKREAIFTMTMGTYTKIFLRFPKKFWFDTEFALYADRERGRYPVWQSLDSPDLFPGSGIIFATVTGDYSERIEALNNATIQTELMSVLRSMYPHENIPDPLEMAFYRWHSDPLYRGSFANWPASFLSEHHDNLRATVAQRLWFAGEATSQKYFGYLHGAYFEGQDIGGEVAKCIHGGGCAGLLHIDEVKNAHPYHI